MKRAVFNFLVLQLVIWTVVFYDGSEATEGVNQASISDTWEVVKVGEQNQKSVVLHYPTFNKLTLNDNGTFVREKNNDGIEKGQWYLNKSKTKLTLMNKMEVKEYDIIQLPIESSESFIIQEKLAESTAASKDVKYELTRL